MPATERLLDLVSPRVGVIRSLSRFDGGPTQPSIPILYQAVLSNFDFRQSSGSERFAVGKGRTETEAIHCAISEALERYCASHFNVCDTAEASWVDISQCAVAPIEFVLYSDDQYRQRTFPYHRWTEQDILTWSLLNELPGGAEIRVPASLIYLLYPLARREDYLTKVTSSGLAAAPDLDDAILNGIYELVERDAFIITWLNQLPMPEVDLSDDKDAQAIIDHYKHFGIVVRAFNITTDIPICVILTIAFDSAGEGPTVVGLGCHLEPRIAARKAIFELTQTYATESWHCQNHGHTGVSSHHDVRTPRDHGAFFWKGRTSEFSFLFDGNRKQPLTSLPNRATMTVNSDLKECVNMLRAIGSRVFYSDLTTDDIQPYEVRVVRTLVTRLQPLHFGFGEERLGGDRLYNVPRILGYADHVRTVHELNFCPHPLA